jgi:hypothetical protein
MNNVIYNPTEINNT